MNRRWFLVIATLPAFASPNPPPIRYVTTLDKALGSYWLAVDAAGSAYASGMVSVDNPSCTLPVLGPDRTSGFYGFVTKIDPGGGVAWTACLTGFYGGPIGLDGAGAIYVASGSTITKLSPNADKIVYSTSLPFTMVRSLVVDKTGNVYLAGIADGSFATTPGAYQTTCAPASDTCTSSYVAKLNAVGAILYATFNPPGSYGQIAVDSRGNVWFAGAAAVTNGIASAVGKLDAAGAHLLFTEHLEEALFSTPIHPTQPIVWRSIPKMRPTWLGRASPHR